MAHKVMDLDLLNDSVVRYGLKRLEQAEGEKGQKRTPEPRGLCSMRFRTLSV